MRPPTLRRQLWLFGSHLPRPAPLLRPASPAKQARERPVAESGGFVCPCPLFRRIPPSETLVPTFEARLQDTFHARDRRPSWSPTPVSAWNRRRPQDSIERADRCLPCANGVCGRREG